jgi:hypothetical protein
MTDANPQENANKKIVMAALSLERCIAEFPDSPEFWAEYLQALHNACAYYRTISQEKT